MFTDLPLDQLRTYESSVSEPADFDAFWERTLAESREHPLDVTVTPVETGLTTIDTFDVTFPGFRGQPIRAWLRLPAGAEGPLPAVVQYIGYGGGRGSAIDELHWASAGYAHLQMDTRGQGSSWGGGDTPDPEGSGPASPGSMTRGIDSPETYYYRRLITDAVRAIDTARSLPQVDASRIAVQGGSQGGGLSIAVAGLVPDLAGVIAFVPFLCDFPRAIVATDAGPYKEIGRYLAVHRDRVDRVLETLSYVDGVVFARRATAPAFMSVALMDDVVPPSTAFGVYNAYAGEKELAVWPYNGHEGGGLDDRAAGLAALRTWFGGSTGG